MAFINVFIFLFMPITIITMQQLPIRASKVCNILHILWKKKNDT